MINNVAHKTDALEIVGIAVFFIFKVFFYLFPTILKVKLNTITNCQFKIFYAH